MTNSIDIEQPDFDANDLTLIDALGRGQSHTRAGKLIGRSSKTVQRRLKDEQFADAVEQRRAEISHEIRRQLEKAASRAIEVIDNCMYSEAEHIRLSAARLALQQQNYSSTLDVAERLDELEQLALKHPTANPRQH